MKKLLLYTIFVFTAVNTSAQSTPADELAGKLLTVFSTRDVKACRGLMLDSSGLEQVVKEYIKRKVHTDPDVSFAERFTAFIELGVRSGVDWSQVKQGKFLYKEDTLVIRAYKLLTGHLNFTSNGHQYLIGPIEAVMSPDGYRVTRVGVVVRGNIQQYIQPNW